jgi:hypothetical protein
MATQREREPMPDAAEDPYRAILGRGSADYLLRNTHQQLVALSSQADLKANILITVSSILLSVVATRTDNDQLRPGLITLMVFLFLSLLAAVVSVLPKFRLRPDRQVLPSEADPLFFGYFARLPRQRYLDEMADVLADDASVYRTLVANIHNQGVYLLGAKYRWLTVGYVCFLTGFLSGGAVLMARVLT